MLKDLEVTNGDLISSNYSCFLSVFVYTESINVLRDPTLQCNNSRGKKETLTDTVPVSVFLLTKTPFLQLFIDV